MKIFKALSPVLDQPLDGFILDDGNKALYMSREGVVTKDFKENRGEQVFPPQGVPVDPRAVRWGDRMVELVNDTLNKQGWHGGLTVNSPLANAIKAVCEREYVPQPDSTRADDTLPAGHVIDNEEEFQKLVDDSFIVAGDKFENRFSVLEFVGGRSLRDIDGPFGTICGTNPVDFWTFPMTKVAAK